MDHVNQYRTIWISDVHLGTRGARAEFLLDFLRRNESETLYLLGDILDGWRLSKTWYWKQSYNDVIQKLLRKARKGTQVVYIPGNHDAFAREYAGVQFGGITVAREHLHEAADGRTFWVIHGDEFDGVIQFARGLALLGAKAYEMSVTLNHWLNQARHRLGYPYWSLSSYLKSRVKDACVYVSRYEDALAGEARRRGVDGVICGHIHKAEMRVMDGVLYCNTGDWVESCTALVEHPDGRLELIQWAKIGHAAEMEEAVRLLVPGLQVALPHP